MKAKEEAGMIVTEGQREALLELQRNYIPCDGNHEWVTDEDHPGDAPHCAKCFVIKEEEQGA